VPAPWPPEGVRWYYSDDSVAIAHADCREVLPLLPPVDLVLTDPPYGLDFRSAEWDGDIPSWWLAAAREIAPIVAFTTAPTTVWDYPRPDWVLCWHREAANSRTAYGGFNHWTPILVYGRGGPSPDTLTLHAIANAQRNGYEHPSPKPIRLAYWLIEGFPAAALILDPFMGSGTTLRAAKDLGRKAIGIEIEERYAEIAAKRMAQGVLKL